MRNCYVGFDKAGNIGQVRAEKPNDEPGTEWEWVYMEEPAPVLASEGTLPAGEAVTVAKADAGKAEGNDPSSLASIMDGLPKQ